MSLLSFGILAWTLGLSQVWAIPVQVAEAPTTDLELTLRSIASARKTLLINIYEMTSPDIADAIVARVKAGVHVELLIEGQPVGGVSPAGRGIQAAVAKAMLKAGRSDRLIEMRRPAGTKRRYNFNHAKYVVIDSQRLLIGSENYSPSGHPTAGAMGNRGWEVLVSDPMISAEFAKIFAQDADPSYGDIVDLLRSASGGQTSKVESFEQELDSFVDLNGTESIRLGAGTGAGTGQGKRSQLPVYSASAVTRITAPDLSLTGLVQLIRGARRTLDIQQMSFDSAWPTGKRSPLVDEIVRAAKRGVRVRVLLNDESVFTHPGGPVPQKNLTTVQLLNQSAGGKLALEARIANLTTMGVSYIHNKGVLVDGTKTLISSINWGSNSILRNREAAILIESPHVHSHYQSLFDSDWQNSAVAPKPKGLPSTGTSEEGLN